MDDISRFADLLLFLSPLLTALRLTGALRLARDLRRQGRANPALLRCDLPR